MAALTAKKQRILTFVIKGLSDSQIGSIVGASPGYISQLRTQDEEFKAALELGLAEVEASAEVSSEVKEEELVTAKYLSLEHAILREIETKLQGAELRDVTRALEVVSSRQEKRADRISREKHPALAAQTNVAVLLMPAHAMNSLQAPTVQVSETGEIIAVGDRSMAPMGASAVRDLFKGMKQVQKLEAAIDF